MFKLPAPVLGYFLTQKLYKAFRCFATVQQLDKFLRELWIVIEWAFVKKEWVMFYDFHRKGRFFIKLSYNGRWRVFVFSIRIMQSSTSWTFLSGYYKFLNFITGLRVFSLSTNKAIAIPGQNCSGQILLFCPVHMKLIPTCMKKLNQFVSVTFPYCTLHIEFLSCRK